MAKPSSRQSANQIVEFPRFSRNQCWLAALLLVTAATMRIYGALNDLWLDEIWSLRLVQPITSPLQVFTKIHHDNNHYLNSLWLYWTGFHGNWPGYRLPSVVAGVGSIVLAGLISRRRSVPAAWFAMLMVAFSYVQILYSSEARGYSEVVFFSLLSFYALEKYLDKQARSSALLFSTSSILGFASHLIFLNFFCAAILWSGWRFMKSGLGARRTIKAMIACHAAPTAFLTALYFVDIRHQVMGGGTEHGAGIYVDSFAWALGAPPGRFTMLPTSVLAVALSIAGLWILWREKSDVWVFYIGVILAVPILLAIVRHSDVLYVRYFIVGMVFLLILWSFVLAALYQRGWPGRITCVLLLAGYFVFNGWHTISLYKHGRGHYGEAARFLAEHTKEPVVTIGSDHDFRNGVVLQFYATEAMADKHVAYYPNSRITAWPEGGPEWFICHKESFADPAPPGTHVTDLAGNRYEFVKSFQTAPLSGVHWYIFHNMAKE
jgi:hypothetical protein